MVLAMWGYVFFICVTSLLLDRLPVLQRAWRSGSRCVINERNWPLQGNSGREYILRSNVLLTSDGSMFVMLAEGEVVTSVVR